MSGRGRSVFALALLLGCASAAPAKEFEAFELSKHMESTSGSLISAYMDWHGAQMAAGRGGGCASVRAVVWKPLAGLGDAAFSLAHVTGLAIKSGRMLFVDWSITPSSHSSKSIPWSNYLAEPFEWDWARAQSSGAVCGAAVTNVIRCEDMDPVGANGPALLEEAAAFAKRAGKSHPSVGTDGFESALLATFLLPSPAVQAHMAPVMEQLEGHFVVAMAIRTGWKEKWTKSNPSGHLQMSHLSEGDEAKFPECWRAIVQQADPAIRGKLKLLLTSDNKVVLEQLRGDPALKGVLVEAGHVGEPSHIHKVSDTVVESGTYRAFADFFLMGFADAAVLTANSLFGDAATKRAGSACLRRYFINHGKCCKEWGTYCKMMCKSALESDSVTLQCPAVLYEKSTDDHAYFPPWRPRNKWAGSSLSAFTPFSQASHSELR